MKISLVTPNVSANCLGRAYILARVLERRHDVEIVGPEFGDGVWPPLAGERLPLDSAALRELPGRIRGDVIYASKPLLASFGVALWKRLVDGRPVVLDIDDWDLGFVRAALRSLPPLRRARHLLGSLVRPHRNHSYWNNLLFESLVGRADAITVSNRFLQRRFGGTLVWHGRDTESFRPRSGDRAELRRLHGLPLRAPVVLFLGTPQPYKGLDDLIDAVASIREPRPVLLLVGIGSDPHGQDAAARAKQALGERAVCLGPQPFARVPEFLALADVAAIPQRRNPATLGQMPAKLFDAMATETPVVSTTVSDIPEALENCGWLVEPGAPAALAAALREILADPAEAKARARRARDRCEALYSWNAMERALAGVFDPLAARIETDSYVKC